MTTEDSIVAAVADAVRTREPLLVQGNGTKSGMLRPVQAARTLSTTGLSGINLYAPKELVISARAGTPIGDIAAAVDGGGDVGVLE